MTINEIIEQLEWIQKKHNKNTGNPLTSNNLQALDEVIGMLKSPKIAYICDRKACTLCSAGDCHHTTDITHAINFEYVFGKYMEKESK